MDTALIVFIVGTIASFLPMYWMALRLLGRKRARATKAQVSTRAVGVPAERREFLELLRQEAAQRAVSVLREAIEEARYAAHRPHGEYHAIDMRTRQSLSDTARLVDSLFQRELRIAFRDAIEAMTTATSASVAQAASTATIAIVAFERAAGSTHSAPAPELQRPQSLWSTLLSRGRGWIGAGGVSATA